MLNEVYKDCQEALAIADDYQKRYQRTLSATCEIYPLLARVLAEWGEIEKAIQLARKGLFLSERWGRINSENLCLSYLGRALVFSNDWEQACQVFDRNDSAAQKISLDYWQDTSFYALDSMLDYEGQDTTRRDQLMHRLQENDAKYPALLTARLLLREGRPGPSLAVLEQALSEISGQLSFDTVRIHALRALAYQAKGDEKQALSALRQALELAEPENRIASFVREGAMSCFSWRKPGRLRPIVQRRWLGSVGSKTCACPDSRRWSSPFTT
jgi:tetratricopeptide (TPR) repeat protein